MRAREQARSHRCTGRIAKQYEIGITCFGGVAIGSRHPPASSAGFCGTQIQDFVVSCAVKFVTHPERTGRNRADALSHLPFPFVHISGTPVRQLPVEAVPDGPAVDIPARHAKQGMDARPVVLDG